MELWVLAFFAIAFAIIIGVQIVQIQVVEKPRTAAIKHLAVTMGASYRLKNPKDCLPAGLWQFHLCSARRTNHHIKNLIQITQDGVVFSIGDYSYSTLHGRGAYIHRQTVIIIESERLNLPPFFLTPQNLVHRLGQLFDFQDIDIDIHPGFSYQYLLKGNDADALRQRFHGGVVNFYCHSKRRTTEGNGSLLIYYHRDYRPPPEHLPELLSDAIALYEQFSQPPD